MIILRYLSREVLQTTLAVTLVLMVVIMSGRFVKYLAEAAAGKFDPTVLFAIMYYRLPGFLELIIPLGFMVAILMAYGRMYAEQEMTVLSSCGLSHKRLLAYTFVPAVVVAFIVGLCSLWLTPLGLQKAEQIIEQQKNRNELELIKPGRFQISSSGKLVSYVESQSKKTINVDKVSRQKTSPQQIRGQENGTQKKLDSIFVATMGVAEGDDLITVRADSAERIEHPEYQQRYLQLNNGMRYQGRPGQKNFRVTKFERFAQHLPAASTAVLSSKKINLRNTAELTGMQAPEAQAALQWRISTPILILVITILGVTMSYTTPRRGRYVMLFPAIILYLIYLVILNAVRGAIEEKDISPVIGLWSVHGAFLSLALFLFALRTGTLARLIRRGRNNKPSASAPSDAHNLPDTKLGELN
jgi:lipopolysaccharide export system permease protein